MNDANHEHDAQPYDVDEQVPKQSAQYVPQRKRLVDPLPLINVKDAHAIKQQLFDRFGLEDYRECATVEMQSRPIPHAFKLAQTRALTDLYAKWLPRILKRIVPEMVPPIQAYNKVSRFGWPYFFVPDDKQPILEEHKSEIEQNGVNAYEDAFAVHGTREQQEGASRKRVFMFLTHQGVQTRTIDKSARMVKTRELGNVVSARTRVIFIMPVTNQYKQPLDTSIHNVYLKYPVFHHDMYGAPYTGEGRNYLALDIKHFERFTAACARVRGEITGGINGAIVAQYSRIPHLVPFDDWKGFAFIHPKEGFIPQFSSGSSEVTTCQKEVFIALGAEYLQQTRHVTDDTALSLFLQGGDEDLTILNYGDDNFFFGRIEDLNGLKSMYQEYLDVEIEDPAKFLGFLFRPIERNWKLGVSSYLLKTHLPERSVGTQFRKFPCYGWMMKRQTYEKYGVPELVTRVFHAENDIMQKTSGVAWSDIIDTAIKEQRSINFSDVWKHRQLALDKDWMLTEKEKLSSGLFFGFTPDRTASMIKRLLGPEWSGKLRF
jgi:hypothetical protein